MRFRISDWSSDVCSSDRPSVDGGLLILQGGKVTWTAPMKLPSDPLSVQLYDRDGEALALINIGGAKSASLSIAPTSPRPKYGVLAFAEGTASAPIQVADLDYLAVTTLPPQKGRKKRLMDTLAEAIHEDLAPIEAFNRLEGIKDEERSSDRKRGVEGKSEEVSGETGGRR